MSESTVQDKREPNPSEININRCVANKKSLSDIDFSMKGGLLECLKKKSHEEGKPDVPTTSPAESSAPPSDPYPWMICCGRNFKSSIFSLQPVDPERRSFSRIRSRTPKLTLEFNSLD